MTLVAPSRSRFGFSVRLADSFRGSHKELTMKKLLALVVAFGVATALVGCGGTTTAPTTKPTK